MEFSSVILEVPLSNKVSSPARFTESPHRHRLRKRGWSFRLVRMDETDVAPRNNISLSSRRVVFFFNPDWAAAAAMVSSGPSGHIRVKDRKLCVYVNIISSWTADLREGTQSVVP
jgi:hypothetical protein